MSKKKIIWALFDTENMSCNSALSAWCEVYSFGLCTGKKQKGINIDLSNFDCVKKEFEKYPLPDYIFASPPCESWVVASASQKAKYTSVPGLNLHWRNKWTPFDFTLKHKQTRINGINTAIFTGEIIKYFQPSYWVIENGNRSHIFDYLEEFGNLIGYRNKCNYYSYGFGIIKRTVIYSNALLFLKNFLPTFKLPQVCDLPSYKRRSLVPEKLYHDIYFQLLFGGQKRLF